MNFASSNFQSKLIFILPFGLFFAFFIWCFSDAIFFWDTVSQASKRGNHFFETNFQSLILSSELDSGHPTFFNNYVAFCWKLFGRTLAVSHWIMLPFVLGIVYQLGRLICNFFPKKWQIWVMLIVIADTTFLAQSILISPDLVMLFGFLLSINAIWEQKKGQLIIGTFLMPFVSIRGIVLLGVIGMLYFLKKIEINKGWKGIKANLSIQNVLKIILPFLPVGILLFGYLFYHFQETGWWISSPNPNWIVHREVNDIKNFLRNVGLIGWRFLDNGRIICSLLLLFFLWKLYKKQMVLSSKGSYLLAAFGAFFLLFFPIFTFFSVAINNRYLLYAFLILHLIICFFVIEYFKKEKLKKSILSMMLILLLSGSFWVYSKHIAQGWDGTLAHLPYYDLRNEMMDFIQKEDISLTKIGTEFPNKGAFDFYDLSNRKEGLVEKNLEENEYIFYSNVMNDFTDEELIELEEEWEIVHELKRVQICVILYRKRH